MPMRLNTRCAPLARDEVAIPASAKMPYVARVFLSVARCASELWAARALCEAAAWCTAGLCEATAWCTDDLCSVPARVVAAEAPDAVSVAMDSARPNAVSRQRREVITMKLPEGTCCRDLGSAQIR